LTRYTLTVVRHGETEWSQNGRHTGRTDIPLTDIGRREASALAEGLRGERFALVLTSPLSRARDTSALAGFADAEVDDDLHEWDYGDYEGRTTPDIQTERPGWFLFNDGVPNGETIDDVAARADRVIARARAAGGNAIAFAHGHFLRVLAARWLEAPPDFARHLLLQPATLSVLGWERAVPALETWNTTVLR
jgi:probable phosphoglycerate mutase